ncbi:LysR family transcriptional regulator [Nocardia sp. NPDC088792]|uniref:LysR family transcriptional regulator n=1 Tax=Nocardia sp. NPDC088792 TaxID=3364332 RepID=UPI003802BA02
MLERYEIETFLTLAAELHFGRTAERLQVSTARVGQIITRLEQRIGVPLFDRTVRRVELTSIGKQLYLELKPAWDQVGVVVQRAMGAAHVLTGTVRVAFDGPASGLLLTRISDFFRKRLPDCDVQLREVRLRELTLWLLGGELDIALSTLPIEEPGFTQGSVLVSEPRLLAVAADHPFAQEHSISLEDLARMTVLQLPGTLPESLRADRTPSTTPAGHPVRLGRSADTFDEILTLVGTGHGVFPVGAQARRYHVRPDIVYVPIRDAPPLKWGLVWRTAAESPRIRAFDDAARDLLRRSFSAPA